MTPIHSSVSKDPIALGVFASRIEAVCDEMGAVLKRAAFSPNIKDRLDFSCAVFDAQGQICAQAAHIPVHLGSMAYAMADIVGACDWQLGDMLVVNDPYLGGTHLPDVTVIAPVFVEGKLQSFVANRAHHANIGSDSPGSMPISSSLEEEGVIIAPTKIVESGVLVESVMTRLSGGQSDTRLIADFAAQISANKVAVERLTELIESLGVETYQSDLIELNDYAERLARANFSDIQDGTYQFSDCLDDDGLGTENIALELSLRITGSSVIADFHGTAKQVKGNINCPKSVVAAAVFYVFRCLLPAQTPACAGIFRPIELVTEKGSLVDAQYPAAVAAGNVETSTRIVDLVLGALAQALPERIPAASAGTMNNIAMGARAHEGGAGSQSWDYYETMAGGMGASSQGPGLSAVQTHMTNTLNTPIESLELHYPLRVHRYQVRENSSGPGLNAGGEGIIREFEFLAPAQATLLTERRVNPPWGLSGGESGAVGENRLNGNLIGAKVELQLAAGDTLSIATPGGGGWGKREV